MSPLKELGDRPKALGVSLQLTNVSAANPVREMSYVGPHIYNP